MFKQETERAAMMNRPPRPFKRGILACHINADISPNKC